MHAAVENLTRSLSKTKKLERKKMESYLPVLAIIASSAPFIGLFVQSGYHERFGEIARTGNASLTAVAPGISRL